VYIRADAAGYPRIYRRRRSRKNIADEAARRKTAGPNRRFVPETVYNAVRGMLVAVEVSAAGTGMAW